MDFFRILASFVLAAESTLHGGVPQSFFEKESLSPEISFHDVVSAVPSVLGEMTSPTPEPTITILPTSTPEPTQKPRKIDSRVTIAFLGDSMMDTLGKNAPELVQELTNQFPTHSFTIFNYGYGSTSIEQAHIRLTEKTTYNGNENPPLLSRYPDILVIESFSYNPPSLPLSDGLVTQWHTLTKLVDTVKAKSPRTKIVIAATIGPNSEVFDKSSHPPAYTPGQKVEHVAAIHTYLANAIAFAHAAHLPLADAYTPSLVTPSHGNTDYISATDGIHYSPLGKKLMAQKIREAIYTYNLVE